MKYKSVSVKIESKVDVNFHHNMEAILGEDDSGLIDSSAG